MKKAYRPPALAVHGSVDTITAILGEPSQHDLLRAGSTVITTGNGSINVCVEVDGACIA